MHLTQIETQIDSQIAWHSPHSFLPLIKAASKVKLFLTISDTEDFPMMFNDPTIVIMRAVLLNIVKAGIRNEGLI